MDEMTMEDRPQFIRAVGVSLLLHVVSAGFFWKVHITAPTFQEPSPFMVRLVSPTLVPRFIDQPAAPPAERPVKTTDISQVTSQARGPGKVRGPVTTSESSKTPSLPQSSRPPKVQKVPPPISPPARPEQPATSSTAPPKPRADLEVIRQPTPSVIPTPQGLPETDEPESVSSQPSFREQIAALGRGTVFEKDKAFDAGKAGNTGTDERTVSLETQSVEFAPYLATVKHRIERQWLVPRFAREVGLTAKLVMLFSITEEGELARLQINKSSGVPILDEAAIEAVKTAAPYSPFPPHFTFRQLNIVATFEYVTRAPRSATPAARGDGDDRN